MKKENAVNIMCPVHNAPLVRKKVLYGYPDPECDLSGYILSGCCIPEHPKRYMYECPTDKEIYYFDKTGALIKYDYE